MGACVITINGTDYYYPCDKKDDISIIDGHIVNTSSQNFTLYHTFPEYGDSSSGYPRITCNSNQLGYIRQSYSSSSFQTVNVSSYEFKTASYGYSVYLLIVILGVLLCQLFKR